MNKHTGLVNNEWVTPRRVQDALSALLLAQGFEAMADAVLTEGNKETLRHYARVIVKNTPQGPDLAKLINNFKLLRLV